MAIKLGLKENIGQFSLLVLINAFVGAMIGLERTILPKLAEVEFHMVAKSAILSFIVVFGFIRNELHLPPWIRFFPRQSTNVVTHLVSQDLL